MHSNHGGVVTVDRDEGSQGCGDAEVLERDLIVLGGQIAQMTCAFLVKLAHFDAGLGWQRGGFATASQWLGWHCAMSATTAREHLRVARTLVDLPQITARFAAGRLSYSKVRALTRIATKDTEADLLEIADHATAGQLDRFVAGMQRARDLEAVNASHARRRLTYWHDADGIVHISARLEPEDGAMMIDALQDAQDYLRATATEESDTVADEETAPRRSLADALVLICQQSSVGSDQPDQPDQGGQPGQPDQARHGGRRSEAIVHATLAQLAQVRPGPVGADGFAHPHLGLGPALHPETARRLTCDTGVVLHVQDGAATFGVNPSRQPGQTVDMGRRRRLPNAAQIRALWARDDGCRFPACARTRYIHAHHVIHWAQGGPTQLENLVLLCGEHHRMLHEGRYTMTMSHDRVRVFDPAGNPVRPPAPPIATDLPPLPAAAVPAATAESASAPPSPARRQPPTEGAIEAPDARPATPLAPVTYDPLDLDYAVSVVATNWELRRQRRMGDPAAPQSQPEQAA